MPVDSEPAEHAAGFCVGAAGLVMSGAVGGALIPMAALTALGLKRLANCDAAMIKRAREGAIAALREAREITEEDARAARELLKSSQAKISFDPARMVRAVRSGNPTRSLMSAVFDSDALEGETPGVIHALELTLETAFEAFRSAEGYQAAFTQEIVLSLLAEQGVVLSMVEETRDNSRLLLQMVADLQQQVASSSNLSSTAREMVRQEDLVLALARRYAEGTPSDFEGALRGLERALEVAAGMQTGLSSNLGEAVDQVLAHVSNLNSAGRITDAADALRTALEEQKQREAEAAEAMTALLRQAVRQAVLARSVEDATRFTLELVDRGEEFGELYEPLEPILWRLEQEIWDEEEPLGAGEAGARMARLRSAWGSWFQAADRNLTFDMEVSEALAREAVRRADGPDQRTSALLCLGRSLTWLALNDSGTGRFKAALEALRASLAERPRERAPGQWSFTQYMIGIALMELGAREGSMALLEESVETQRAALGVMSYARSPVQWALTQNALGNSLLVLGERDGETRSLEEAAEALRLALGEFSRDRLPIAWAYAQNNLGNALALLGEREGDPGRLRDGIRALCLALEEMTPDRTPLDSALFRSDLGRALALLGCLESDTGHFAGAIESLRAALEAATRDLSPAVHATTQARLAAAELAWAERLSPADAWPHLVDALSAGRAAVEEYARSDTPFQHERASAVLGRIRSALARLDAGTWPTSAA